MMLHNFIKLKVFNLSNLDAWGNGIGIILIAKNIVRTKHGLERQFESERNGPGIKLIFNN